MNGRLKSQLIVIGMNRVREASEKVVKEKWGTYWRWYIEYLGSFQIAGWD